MIDEFPKRRTRITLFATYPSKPLPLAIMSRVPRIPQLKSAFYLFLDAGLLNRLFNGLFGGDFGLFKLDLFRRSRTFRYFRRKSCISLPEDRDDEWDACIWCIL